MHSKLICYQLKLDYYKYIFSVILNITTKQKPTVETQKRKRLNHNTTKNNEITKEERKKGSTEQP